MCPFFRSYKFFIAIIDKIMKYVICSMVLFTFLFSCSSRSALVPVVKNGYIDLQDWDFIEDGSIGLKGNWQFKWMSYDDEYLDREFDTSEWDTIKVPSFWNSKKGITGEGYACMRLIIKTNKKNELGIYLKSCLSAYDLYINKEKIMSAGIFGYDKKSTIPQIKANFIKIQPASDTITIVMRISNFHAYDGGPESIPIIGDYDTLKKELWLEDFARMISIGIIFMMIVYNFFLWMGRKKDNNTIFFALFCCFIFIRSCIFNGFFVKIVSYPDVSLFDLHYKIEFLTETLGVFLLSNCLRLLFPGETNKDVLKITNVLFLSLSVFIILLNARQNVAFSLIYHIVTLPAVLWLLYTLILGIIRKRRGAFFLLFGFIILSITMLNDILFSRRIIYTLFLSDTGSTVLCLAHVLMTTGIFSHNLKQVEYLSRDLQKEVLKQTKELVAEKTKIEQQSEQKTVFFINFAHEIKTPLAIIQNTLNEYLKKIKLTDELKIIKANINKLYRDIVNLLDTRKIEQCTFSYNNDTIIDASQTLVRILDQFKVFARSSRIQLTFSGEDSLFIKIDPYAFERIINNIIDNAIKYTKENGHVDVRIASEPENIIITVQDDGIGISEEQQKNIFLPYYQVSREKQNIQGLGLGLYIVKNVLDSFKGRIRIKSKLNKGTVVTIRFPRHVSAETVCIKDFVPQQQVYEEFENKPPEDRYDKNKPTVFIVEDNIKLISFMQKSMSENFNVMYATDGKEGLERLNVIPKPDIIISDIMMKTMDGHEFYNKLTTIERLMDVPFIFLTAKTGREEKIKSLKKGVIDYIYKPFDKEELIEKVKSILKNRQAHTESEIRKMEKRLSTFLRTTDDDEFLSFEKKCSMYSISPREKEVLRELLEGMQIKEIAGKLFLSVHTIRNHIRHIYNKCKVQNRVELVNLFNKK